MEFVAKLELHGKTSTGIKVPAQVLKALGEAKRPAIVVQLGDFSFRTTVGVMGGKSLIPVSAETRKAAGVSAGDELTVDVILDASPREIGVPQDLAVALKSAKLMDAFAALAPSRRKEHVRSIQDAKTPATRERRIAKAIETLSS